MLVILNGIRYKCIRLVKISLFVLRVLMLIRNIIN